MKITAILSLVLSALFTGTAPAQLPASSLVVVAKIPTAQQWATAITGKLQRHLYYPAPFSNEPDYSGIVAVTFRSDRNGQPVAVTVVRKSGHRALDRAASTAVARIATLFPMPHAYGPDQKFRANILFATSPDQLQEQADLLRQEAAMASTVPPGSDTAIVLDIGSHAGPG